MAAVAVSVLPKQIGSADGCAQRVFGNAAADCLL